MLQTETQKKSVCGVCCPLQHKHMLSQTGFCFWGGKKHIVGKRTVGGVGGLGGWVFREDINTTCPGGKYWFIMM